MKTRTATLALVAILAAGIAGCAKQDASASSGTVTVAATNTKCPYTGNPVNKTVTSTYDSKSVAFCCNGCKGKFDSAASTDKAAVMAKAK